jgi:hypothetical protein
MSPEQARVKQVSPAIIIGTFDAQAGASHHVTLRTVTREIMSS